MDGIAKLLYHTLDEKLNAQLAPLSLKVSQLEGKYGELSSGMRMQASEVDKTFSDMHQKFEHHIASRVWKLRSWEHIKSTSEVCTVEFD